MDSNLFMAIGTGALVFVGAAQVVILFIQHRHNQITLIEEFRKQFSTIKFNLGILVFLGRSPKEYYQILTKTEIRKLERLSLDADNISPTIWALDAAKSFFPYFSGVCLKVLQGQLSIQDIYPLFGTELLRHSLPLKRLLENFHKDYFPVSEEHKSIRFEIQDWLLYHDGIRRRCLILLDLLWAEAARLEDLSPSDLISAADVKRNTGLINRNRLFDECKRINRQFIPFKAYSLSCYLRHSEYREYWFLRGLDKTRLRILDESWIKKLLGN
ncbi:hypothetical protein [Leptospira meyeri]|uniref:hypothetical protein n=1 Tax=Leptospira meyeri TaxID=29508 RepID=UPI0002BEF909|nr:hypothetical protein [Leptospira meyeri]EMJ90280.1 hypothetical protein LEP1GSC196_0216 [Leptospira meyeri serovar Semaranga str. Veldrot Semarang 173]